MKKAIALLILICMVILASVSSFATNPPNEINPAKEVSPPKVIMPPKGDKLKQNTDKALNAQIRVLEKQMEQNSKKLDRLRNQSLKAWAAAKARLAALQKHIKSLTKDQVDALVEDIKLLKQYKDEFNSMNNDISTDVQTLNDAKSQNKLDLVIQTLNEIIAAQNEKITHFKEIIDGLNQIAVV